MNSRGRRGRALWPHRLSCAAFLLAAWLTPSGADAQRIGVGFASRGIQIDVDDQPYEIRGNTARDLYDQMRMLGPRGRWTSFPYRYRWSYGTLNVPTAGGFRSDKCSVDEFEMRFTVEAYYPRWNRPEDAPAELVAAWDSFEALLLEYWEERQGYMIELAREVYRRVEEVEEVCGLMRQLTNRLVRETADELNQAEREAMAEGARVQVRWPPEGFEELFSDPPALLSREGDPATRPSSERRSGTFGHAAAADIRPSGMTGVVAGHLRVGEPELLEAWGWADPEEQESLTLDAVFRFPAFAEVVVSTLAEVLDREGLVDLEAPLASYLPDMDDRLGAVSLYSLLSHQSGLDNSNPRASVWPEILDNLDDRALFTDPGAVFSFSRYDYPLALRALEQSFEGDLATAANQWVFEPLGMVNTSLGGVKEGLPIVLTTAPDLLRFGSTLIEGGGDDMRPLPTAPGSPALLDGVGRWFEGGFWRDFVEGESRASLMCGAGFDRDAVGFQVFPESGVVSLFWSRTRNPDQVWPTVGARFLMDGLASDLGVETDLLEPRRVRGDGQVERGPRPCEEPRSNTVRADDPGSPAPAEDWAGRYANGDRIIELLDREGFLRLLAGMDSELEVRTYRDDTYLATVGERPLWPFRLVRDESGRRYAVLGDRAYINEEDRPGG